MDGSPHFATSRAVPPTAPALDLTDDVVDILDGLTADQKHIAPKFFYDERGSQLFDLICELPEYYPTRTELKLMRTHMHEVADLVGPRASVIEFGAGSSVKIRVLLDHLIEPVAYVPVDISAEYLVRQADDLASDYPEIDVTPVCADFTRPFMLPAHRVLPRRNVVFFPGSTIGNFSRPQALELLEVMAFEAKQDGALLIGVDLRKDPSRLRAAYNDQAGVTAEFNLNVLARLNREFGADFDLNRFRHLAVYDEKNARIEMRLVSTRRQRVRVLGTELDFAKDEYIITEHSHKYSVEEFRELARRAGFESVRTWVDGERLFSVHYLRVP
jgi:L-histidine Nalpha-methyltransferase